MNRMDVEDAYRFNMCVMGSPTLTECRSMFRDAIAAHGFTTFACGELDLRDRDRTVFHIIDWTEEWTRFYLRTGLLNRDPVVEALAARTSSFTWSELRADRTFSRAGQEALSLAAAAGWTEGLAVPLPQGGSRRGLVSMAGTRPVTDPAIIAYLTLISICLFHHARTLVPSQGFAIPPAGLTEREIECLRLVARGLSDKAIATTLGIAVSTAHEFVEKAKRRLKVKSRPELVAVAVSLGIVGLP